MKDDAGGGIVAHPGNFLKGEDGAVVAFLHAIVAHVHVGELTDVVGGHALHHPHHEGIAVAAGGGEDGLGVVELPCVVLLLGEGGGFSALVGGLEIGAHLRLGGKDGLLDDSGVALCNLVHPVLVEHGFHFFCGDKHFSIVKSEKLKVKKLQRRAMARLYIKS